MKTFILITLTSLTIFINLTAQDLHEVCFHGYVTDSETGKGVVNVKVEVINEADPAQKCSGKTDITGRYELNLATAVTSVPQDQKPVDFKLKQNYPNPFNPSTLINFQLPRSEHIQIIVYNTLGQKIKTLVNGRYGPGYYTMAWDATDENGNGVAAGIYFYQLRAGKFLQTNKMVLLDGNNVGKRTIHNTSSLKQNDENNTLSKSNLLTVTIRAVGARIYTFKKQHITVTENEFRFDMNVDMKQGSLLNKDLVNVSEPDDLGMVSICGVEGTVNDKECRISTITVVNWQTFKQKSIHINHDGGFPVLYMEAAVGDILSVILTSEGGELDRTLPFSVLDNIPPKVTSSAPTNGDKDIIIDSIIIIRFTEPVNRASVNENSFSLFNAAGNVTGTIDFIDDDTGITFTPAQLLEPNTAYTINITTDVTDKNGNHLENMFIATFTTNEDNAGLETQWIKHKINNNCWGHIHDLKLVDMNNDNQSDVLYSAGVNMIFGGSKRDIRFCGWLESPTWDIHTIGKDESTNNIDKKDYDITPSDIDGDGYPDAVVTTFNNNIVGWFEFHIPLDPCDFCTYYRIKFEKNINYPYDVVVTDMDADSDPDVMVTIHNSGKILWYEFPDWTNHVIEDSLAGAANVCVADMDGDIDKDVVATGMEANAVVLYRAPYWDKIYIDKNLTGAEYVNIADLNADGKPDVLATGIGEQDVVWYEAPSWTKHVISNNLEYACDVKAADMNGDMMLDVVATDSTSHFVVWFKAPDWSMHIIDSELHNPSRVEIGDMDGDSDMDIVASGSYNAEIVWYEQVVVKK